jgi:hypothetical protein
VEFHVYELIHKYRVILNYGVSVAYNFQAGNNKIKLFTEYESVTQEVLLLMESILQNAKQPCKYKFGMGKIT